MADDNNENRSNLNDLLSKQALNLAQTVPAMGTAFESLSSLIWWLLTLQLRMLGFSGPFYLAFHLIILTF